MNEVEKKIGTTHVTRAREEILMSFENWLIDVEEVLGVCEQTEILPEKAAPESLKRRLSVAAQKQNITTENLAETLLEEGLGRIEKKGKPLPNSTEDGEDVIGI